MTVGSPCLHTITFVSSTNKPERIPFMAAGLSTGAGPPVVNVYHEKSRILPDVSRVLACLIHLGVISRVSNLLLVSLQASRSVPVPFYDGPVFLQDSRAICRYIAETYEHQGYPFLLGKDGLERASIEQWLRHEEHAFDPPSRALFCHLAFPPQYEDEDDQEAMNQETRKLEEVLEVYEQRLGETKFLAGNKFTLADLVHLPGTHHVITSERFAYLYDSRKNVQRWWNNISARESWQQVLRDMKNVEEQHELEKQQELEEKQKQQWLTAPSPMIGGRDIRIDPRKQDVTKPQTVLVGPPPSIGVVSTSIPPAPQDHGTTSDQKPSSPKQTIEGGFFTPTEKPPPPSTHTGSITQKSLSSDHSTKSTFFTPASTPTTAEAHQRTDAENPSYKSPENFPLPSRPTDPTAQKTPSSVDGTKSTFFTPSSVPNSAKMHPKTDDDKPSYKTDSSPRKTGQRSPKEAPDEAGSLAKPSSQDYSKISPDSELNSSKTEKKPTGLGPQNDKSIPSTYTTPDTQTPQTPYIKPSEQRGTDTSFGSEPSQKLKSVVPTAFTPSNGDTQDVITDEDRFSTKRLRAVFNPDIEDSQYPFKQEEAPADPNKQSVHDTEKQPTMIQDSGKSGGSPSPGMRAPYAPFTDEGRSAILPPKGGMATSGSEKSPFNQQVPPGGPSTDNLDKTVGVDTGAPQGTSPKNPADPSTIVTGDEQQENRSTKSEMVMKTTQRKITPAGSRSTSASVEEVKQEPAGLGGILDVQDNGGGDTTEKTIVDKRAAKLTSRQTTEPIKGVGPTLEGITGDESTKAEPTGPVEEPAFGEQNKHTVPHGGAPDSNGKEGVKTSPSDPRGMLPTTLGRLASNPATQLPTASDKMTAQSPEEPSSYTRNEKTKIVKTKMSAQSPEVPLSYTRNEKIQIVETSQISTAAPNEKPGGRVLRNAGESSSGSSPMRNVTEQGDQSGDKLVENRMRQGDDVAQNAKTGKRKEEDYIANADNNRKAQATIIDAPSKLQMQSVKNKSETSEDGDMGINETAKSRSLETSREVQPSSAEKSMGRQQLQEIRSTASLQDNVKKSTNAPPLRSGTEQQNKDDFLNEDTNSKKAPREASYEEKNSSDTSSKPTQFEGNEDNLPESQRHGL